VGRVKERLAHLFSGSGSVKVTSSIKPFPFTAKKILPPPQGKLPAKNCTFSPLLAHLYILFLCAI
jgi:hypothetical protein